MLLEHSHGYSYTYIFYGFFDTAVESRVVVMDHKAQRKVKVKSLSHIRLCDPMDCSLPGSSIHGILQASILEWVAISFSRRSSQPRDWTWVSHIAGRCFTIWATREALKYLLFSPLVETFANFGDIRSKEILRCQLFWWHIFEQQLSVFRASVSSSIKWE